MVQTEFLLRVKHAGHQSVNGNGRDGKPSPVFGGAQDTVDSRFVVERIDQDTKDIFLAFVAHWSPHRSTLSSKISRRICGTLYCSFQPGWCSSNRETSLIHQM